MQPGFVLATHRILPRGPEQLIMAHAFLVAGPKARAGADVTANAFSVGVLGPLGGWVAITGSPSGFPWPIAVVAAMGVAALYLVTTVVDHDSDRAAGIRTTAVVPGRRATSELGFALWAGSAGLALVLAILGIVAEPSLIPGHLVLIPGHLVLIPVHLVLIPVLLLLYRILVIRKRPTFRAVTLLAAAYLLLCTAFVLTYVDSL